MYIYTCTVHVGHPWMTWEFLRHFYGIAVQPSAFNPPQKPQQRGRRRYNVDLLGEGKQIDATVEDNRRKLQEELSSRVRVLTAHDEGEQVSCANL